MPSSGSCFALLIALLSLQNVWASIADDPDYGADTRELILSRGFDYEEHEIETQDGYILTTFRILNDEIEEPKMTVLLVHGILSSSRDWLIAGPDGHVKEGTKVMGSNLGFELAKRGYDVWLTNSRGNTYSQNSTRYRTQGKINENNKFWDFSHEDMARYDVPATVSYILRATGRETIGYIGHSRGTTILFAALVMYPHLNDQIQPFIAIAPVVTTKFAMGALASPMIKLALLATLSLDYPLGHVNILPDDVKRVGCSFANGVLCTGLIQLAGGDKAACFNRSRLPIITSGFPAGTSLKDARFFMDEMISGRFGRYDYGWIENMKIYGSLEPPEYDMNKITNHDIYIMRGAHDILSNKFDVSKLVRKLGNRLREDIEIDGPGWGHVAVQWAKDTAKYLNTPLIKILDQYV